MSLGKYHDACILTRAYPFTFLLHLDKEHIGYPPKHSDMYPTSLWGPMHLHMSIEWGMCCAGKNTGNQETGSILGLPPTSRAISEKLL
jgi:hypothetical protein